MFILFTDFGLTGPYTGQMKARLIERAPAIPIVDLMANAPQQNPKASAYLLAAYANSFPPGSIFVSVVDPGVGGDRPGVVIFADDKWFVGPGNGLFEIVLRRAKTLAKIWEIDWMPEKLSSSFHGRDIFAPIAGMIANGENIPGQEQSLDWQRNLDWPDNLAEVIYIDVYGNAITGLGETSISIEKTLHIGQHEFSNAKTFSSVSVGEAFWYVNSNSLVELAMNKKNISQQLNVQIGAHVNVSDGAHC